MKKELYLIVIMFFAFSCAQGGRQVPILCEAEWGDLFSRSPGTATVQIEGGMRIDVPRYRVRGGCSIEYDTAGALRLDFQHSSMFGAYREDATIFVRDGRMEIFDHERERFYGSDSSQALLERHLGIDIQPDDLVIALLLAAPACSEIISRQLRGSEDEWSLEGVWRGRRIAVAGERGKGPISFRLSSGDDKVTYLIKYRYDGNGAAFSYPERITVTREHGPERLSLEVHRAAVPSRGWSAWPDGGER